MRKLTGACLLLTAPVVLFGAAPEIRPAAPSVEISTPLPYALRSSRSPGFDRGYGGDDWKDYRSRLYARLISEVNSDGYWAQDHIGPVYTTALNLTILQLDKGVLPIYQR